VTDCEVRAVLPLSAAEAWRWLGDLRRVASCIPGAQLTDAGTHLVMRAKVDSIVETFRIRLLDRDVDPVDRTARIRISMETLAGVAAASGGVSVALVESERTDPSGRTSVAVVGVDLDDDSRSQGWSPAVRRVADEFADRLSETMGTDGVSSEPAAQAGRGDPPEDVTHASIAVPPSAAVGTARTLGRRGPIAAAAAALLAVVLIRRARAGADTHHGTG